MTDSFRFEQLIVYKSAVEFTKDLYSETLGWPKTEQFGLVNQCRRASVSIALNIAEGSSRTRKDFQHFISLSRGSCFEVAACLQIALSLEFLSESDYQKLYVRTIKIAKMLSSLKSSISK